MTTGNFSERIDIVAQPSTDVLSQESNITASSDSQSHTGRRDKILSWGWGKIIAVTLTVGVSSGVILGVRYLRRAGRRARDTIIL